VDDDAISRALLEALIAQNPHLECSASLESAEAAIQYFKTHVADVLFLDIEMPGKSGLEMLETITLESDPYIILVSGKDGYAIKAFEYHVYDFIVKPIDPERFDKTIHSILKSKNRYSTKDFSNLFVKMEGQLHRITVNTILWVEANGDFVKIHTPNKDYEVRAKMLEIEEKLPSSQFFRVHRSYVVNISKIDLIQDNVLVIGNKLVPVSKNKIEDLLQLLNILS
ncbi:MAG: LytTR family DNA-binding domain-containing protein, partial [Bacteroidia bacterium]|nr:LytTR family DNA-binding domain-containing protein [Bacteroidia bacterium]